MNELAVVYTPKCRGRPLSNYMRQSRIFESRAEANVSPEARLPGAVIAESWERQSFQHEL